jgi:hypothetical protein
VNRPISLYVSYLVLILFCTCLCAFLSLSSFLSFFLMPFCLLSRDTSCLASFFHTAALFHNITELAWATRGRNDLQRSAHSRQLSLSHPTIHSATLLHRILSRASLEHAVSVEIRRWMERLSSLLLLQKKKKSKGDTFSVFH